MISFNIFLAGIVTHGLNIEGDYGLCL